MENSLIQDLEVNSADETILDALLEEARKAPGEAALEALLSATDSYENETNDEAFLFDDEMEDTGEAGLEALLAKTDPTKGESALEALLEKTESKKDVVKPESAMDALLAKADKQIAANKGTGSKASGSKASGSKDTGLKATSEGGVQDKVRQKPSQEETKANREDSHTARAAKDILSIKTEMLLVHADSTQRSVLEMSFISEGYKVVNFETGKEALNYLKTNVPDIMLLDADMEKLTGMDICFRIRKIKRFEEVPVIIMTESNDDKTETMIKMCRASDFFPKASKTIELKAKVRKLLDNSDIQKLTKVE